MLYEQQGKGKVNQGKVVQSSETSNKSVDNIAIELGCVKITDNARMSDSRSFLGSPKNVTGLRSEEPRYKIFSISIVDGSIDDGAKSQLDRSDMEGINSLEVSSGEHVDPGTNRGGISVSEPDSLLQTATPGSLAACSDSKFDWQYNESLDSDFNEDAREDLQPVDESSYHPKPSTIRNPAWDRLVLELLLQFLGEAIEVTRVSMMIINVYSSMECPSIE